MPVPLHHAPTMVVAPERLSPRTTKVGNKAVIQPAARYARVGKGCKGNQLNRTDPWGLLGPSARVAPPEV